MHGVTMTTQASSFRAPLVTLEICRHSVQMCNAIALPFHVSLKLLDVLQDLLDSYIELSICEECRLRWRKGVSVVGPPS